MDRQKAESDAKSALKEWNIEADSVSLEAVSENITFKVSVEDSKAFVLRFHRPGYHSLEALKSERVWTKALRESGLDCPVGISTPNGDDYVRLPMCGEMRNAGLAEWVEGDVVWHLLTKPNVSSNDIALWFIKTGQLLAEFHNHAAMWKVPPEFTRHRLDEHGFLGENPFWGRFWESREVTESDRKYLSILRARSFELLVALPHDQENFGMIHADLHPGNLIRHKDGLHVIDFDDAGFGWYIYDFAVALLNFRDDANYELYRDSLFEGYVEIRALPNHLLPTLDLFYLIRNLAHIGWLADRPELNHHNGTKHNLDFVYQYGEQILTANERST